jgi:hypothetical protein
MDYVYNSYKTRLITGDVDLLTDTINVALLSGYTPDLDNHEYFSDVNVNELSNGNGYSTGGEEITSKSTSVNLVDNRGEFSCDNVVWPSASFTARYAVVYKDTGNVTTSPLLFYIDFGENKTANNGSFTLVWHPQGAFLHNGYEGA